MANDTGALDGPSVGLCHDWIPSFCQQWCCPCPRKMPFSTSSAGCAQATRGGRGGVGPELRARPPPRRQGPVPRQPAAAAGRFDGLLPVGAGQLLPADGPGSIRVELPPGIARPAGHHGPEQRRHSRRAGPRSPGASISAPTAGPARRANYWPPDDPEPGVGGQGNARSGAGSTPPGGAGTGRAAYPGGAGRSWPPNAAPAPRRCASSWHGHSTGSPGTGVGGGQRRLRRP